MSLSRTLMLLKYLKLTVVPSTARFSCSFRSPSTKHATIVEKKVTSLPIAPSRTRERRTTRANIAMTQAMMMKMKRRTRTRNLGRRRAMTRRPSSSQKKGHTKRSFLVEKQKWVTDVSSSEDSSDEEDIVTIALTNEEPSLPPPPMCLMAKGNTKVCEVDSD